MPQVRNRVRDRASSGNNPSSAAACYCATARTTDGREARQSGSYERRVGLIRRIARLARVDLFLAVADQVQRPRGKPLAARPMDERILFTMRDPKLGAAGRENRVAELVPVRMVGNDERQLDAALARTRTYAHPSRGKRGH